MFLRTVWENETLAAEREAFAQITLNLKLKKHERMALFDNPDTNEKRLAATFMGALTPSQATRQYPYLLTDLSTEDAKRMRRNSFPVCCSLKTLKIR